MGEKREPVSREPITIQLARLEDVDELVRIEREAFSAPWTRAMFEAELTGNPFSTCFTARRGEGNGSSGVIVGYLCGWVVFDEFRLMTLAVDRMWRRQGLGNALLQHGLASAQERGGLRALLEVRASNTGALALYERLGFRRQAVRRQYYTNPPEDAILMIMDPIQVAENRRFNTLMVQ